LAACGVLTGAATHLIWDAFTHEKARGVRLIPWIEEPVVDIGSHRVTAVRLLQDGSSLIGLLIVLVLVWYGLRRGHGQSVPGRLLRPTERRAWVFAYVAAALVLTGGWLWGLYGELVFHSVTSVVTGVAVAALRGLATALLVTSLALDWRLSSLRSPGARAPG